MPREIRHGSGLHPICRCLHSLFPYAACQVRVLLFRGKRRRKRKTVGKEEEQNVSSRPNLHLSLLTHHFPSLSLLLSLPAPPPFISPSLSDFFFVLPPPSPPRCIRFTVLYLPSLCKILLALFSSFALLRLSSRFFPPQQQLWRGQMR